jgi:hypothetical protein
MATAYLVDLDERDNIGELTEQAAALSGPPAAGTFNDGRGHSASATT